MSPREANRLLREAIIQAYFAPQLKKLGYNPTKVKHPAVDGSGVSKDDVLHLFFDAETGADYPDGDEWLMVEYLLPRDVDLPDRLKNPDYFTSLGGGKVERQWRHREIVRYRHGRLKRLEEALVFIDKKREELYSALRDNSVTSKLEGGKS